jgi:hypothetical protein
MAAMIFVVVRLCHLQKIDWHFENAKAPVITADVFNFFAGAKPCAGLAAMCEEMC